MDRTPRHSYQAPLSVLPDALVSVLVFAGAAFHELHDPLPETRLEGSYHSRSRTTDHHARRDRDGQERGFCRFVVHVARFAAALCRQELTGHVVRRRAVAFVEPIILAEQILYACLSDAM